MTLDEVVSSVKGDFAAWIVELLIKELALAPIMSIPVIGPIISFLLYKVANVIADKIDLGGYYLFKLAKNNADADRYQDSIRETREITKKGDLSEIAKARANQRERFGKLMLLSA